MPDGTVFVLLVYLAGTSPDSGHIGAIFSRKELCEMAKHDDYKQKAKYHPTGKEEFACWPWTLINDLEEP